MKVEISNLCLGLFILSLMSVTSGLKCYMCSGDGCGGYVSQVACDAPPNDTIKVFCIKYAEKDLVQYKGCIQTGKLLYGSIIFSNATVGCITQQGQYHLNTECLCNTDGCNGSNQISVSSIWSLGILIVINLLCVFNIC